MFLVLYDTATLLNMLCIVCCRSVCALPDVPDTAMFLKMLFVVCYEFFVYIFHKRSSSQV